MHIRNFLANSVPLSENSAFGHICCARWTMSDYQSVAVQTVLLYTSIHSKNKLFAANK